MLRTLWGGSTALLGVVIVALLGVILFKTPTGHPAPTSPVQHRFTQQSRFHRYTLTNIIPEAEQVNLGFLVMPYLDPILTAEQSQRVAAFTNDLYREMESDANFHQLGSVMGWTYAELFRRPFNVGHYYLYIPESASEAPLPAIVFLHGSAGNFKAYTWLLSKLAERRGLVIIAPSFGFGNWRQSGGVEAVLDALDDAAQLVEINQDEVYLLGLSNGGLGVSQLAARSPERFRGLVFISPVMDTELVAQKSFHDLWQNRSVLIISGENDQRVPISYVKKRVSTLQSGGVDVTALTYPGEDHFLLFAQPKRVLDDISAWLSEVGETTSQNPSSSSSSTDAP